MHSPYPGNHQVCSRCIMDDTAQDITFDDDGVCNYCTEFLVRMDQFVEPDPAARQAKLDDLVAKVKAQGAGKPYDCIIGVSGGVDSSSSKGSSLTMCTKAASEMLAISTRMGISSRGGPHSSAGSRSGVGSGLWTVFMWWAP